MSTMASFPGVVCCLSFDQIFDLCTAVFCLNNTFVVLILSVSWPPQNQERAMLIVFKYYECVGFDLLFYSSYASQIFRRKNALWPLLVGHINSFAFLFTRYISDIAAPKSISLT